MADIRAYARLVRDAVLHGLTIGNRARQAMRRIEQNPRGTVNSVLTDVYQQQVRSTQGAPALQAIVEDHDRTSQSRMLGWTAAGLLGLTTAVLSGMHLSQSTPAEAKAKPAVVYQEPAKTQPVVSPERHYLSTESYHIDALAKGIWYAEKDVPAGDITDYSIVLTAKSLGKTTDTRFLVDKNSVEKLQELIKKAEENDGKNGRLSDHRVKYYSKEIEELVEALPGNTIYGKSDRIKLTDVEQGFKDIGAYGGMKEIRGN